MTCPKCKSTKKLILIEQKSIPGPHQEIIYTYICPDCNNTSKKIEHNIY